MNTNNFIVKRSKSGLGLFAVEGVTKGVFLMEYTGKVLTNNEAEKINSRYLFRINSRLIIDGQGRENISRYINHSCNPNCEVRIKSARILIYAIKNIQPGEELGYDYGKEYFEEFIRPAGCKCKKCIN
ncbi:MAG: hypothetical protein ACD_9C00262G0005 [uncultured bacterium]|nr:MAG: hypothetical protein ACD_9C00262G0005 [uncultured bacterium]